MNCARKDYKELVENTDFIPKKATFTPIEAATIMGVSRATIYGWISRGVLKAQVIGPRLMRIKRVDLVDIWREIDI